MRKDRVVELQAEWPTHRESTAYMHTFILNTLEHMLAVHVLVLSYTILYIMYIYVYSSITAVLSPHLYDDIIFVPAVKMPQYSICLFEDIVIAVDAVVAVPVVVVVFVVVGCPRRSNVKRNSSCLCIYSYNVHIYIQFGDIYSKTYIRADCVCRIG